MARPTKIGLDYFSHDTNTMADFKMRLLTAKLGLVGYAIYFRMLEEAYREYGYYLEDTDEFALLFSSENKITICEYEETRNFCLQIGLFDKEKHQQYKILTSERMQNNYKQVANRRADSDILEEYKIEQNQSVSNNSINVSNNSINVSNNSVNVDNNTQRKVKESIGKKSIGKKRKEKESIEDSVPSKKLYLEYVYLTEDEHTRLIERYGKPKTEEYIERLNDYIFRTGKDYASHNRTIQNWLKKDEEKNPINNITARQEEVPVYMRDFEEGSDFFEELNRNRKNTLI